MGDPGPLPTALSRLDESARAEYWAALALRRTKGLGARSIHRLLTHFGSAFAAVHHAARWAEAGVPVSRGAGLSDGAWRREARPEWEDSRDLDGVILLWTDPRYPSLLRQLPDAPALLYARGDLSLLNNACLAVVGSRACSADNLRRTRDLARELSACGVTVVSGLARGIDSAAHTAALAEQGRTIAVLGAGLDVVYPPENRQLYHDVGVRGLLLSEFPPGTRPEGPHFPIRNRIISGLALGVVVVEAAPRSGSLITARLALEQNRAVYAVPPRGWTPPVPADRADAPQTDGTATENTPDLNGCARLLADGARPVRGAADILEDLLPQLRHLLDHVPPGQSPPAEASAPPHLRSKAAPGSAARRPGAPACAPDSAEGRALALLQTRGPLHMDDLLILLPDQNAGSLSALLLMLELNGSVQRLPGAVYEARQS
ncbi:MAG: DNA-processing protein DprA [Desulfovibrionaceae bacterium]|nr:DNA-processing protein DprA [Desulfovibrionaceae bacterium]